MSLRQTESRCHLEDSLYNRTSNTSTVKFSPLYTFPSFYPLWAESPNGFGQNTSVMKPSLPTTTIIKDVRTSFPQKPVPTLIFKSLGCNGPYITTKDLRQMT